MIRITRMEAALQPLKPIQLIFRDDSASHAGHAGARPEGETHYSLVMVAEAFQGKSRIERQRMVQALLQPELDNGLHALSMKLHAPSEVEYSD